MSGAWEREREDAALGIRRWEWDDALVAAARADGRARVRAAAWPLAGAPPVAVVVGHGGRAAVEVAADAARADGVPLYRRPGGGCAVVLDPGNAVVSVAWPQPGIGGITSAFARISGWLIEALARCGVPGVTRQGTSDLALDGRKIGGSCLWRTRGLVHYATTLLVAPDLDLVERYLPHPPREPAWRRGRAHREFMGAVPPAVAARGAPALAADLAAALDASRL